VAQGLGPEFKPQDHKKKGEKKKEGRKEERKKEKTQHKTGLAEWFKWLEYLPSKPETLSSNGRLPQKSSTLIGSVVSCVLL
jgi:hypothetical protein